MKEKTKEYMKLILFAILVLAFVLYFKDIVGVLEHFVGVLSPLLLGIVVAFVLNVPMKAIEKLIGRIDRKQKCKKGLKRALAILLTFVIIIVVLVAVISLLAPNIIRTVGDMVYLLQNELPDFISELQKKYHLDLSQVQTFVDSLKLDNLLLKATTMLGGMTTALTTTFSKLFQLMMALIVACYLLAEKEKFGRQTNDVLKEVLKEKPYRAICHVGSLINDTYESFLGGQCTEALIIATLMTITLSICRIPYAVMIGVLAGVLSFIPFIGSFVACFCGAFFILLQNPWMALLEIIVYQVVQFVEGQFIYPRVVGKSVGLPPVFTLVAALIGGNLFGLVGMIFFIPIVAVIYSLVREFTYERLKKKEQDSKKMANDVKTSD